MTASLSTKDFNVVREAMMDAAGMAPTERKEGAILDALRKLERDRSDRDASELDANTIRRTIEEIKRVARVQRLTTAMLDEVATALIEGRKVNIKVA